MTNLKQIKKYKGWTTDSRFIAELSEEPIGYIPRCLTTPYAYGPTHSVWDWNGKAIVKGETSHRTFTVYEVLDRSEMFSTEEEAQEVYINSIRKEA